MLDIRLCAPRFGCRLVGSAHDCRTRSSETVELRRVLAENLSLGRWTQLSHIVRGRLQRIGVQARRVREVGLEQDVVLPNLPHDTDEVRSLEPHRGVYVALEKLPRCQRESG